jgi:hypothetical protein
MLVSEAQHHHTSKVAAYQIHFGMVSYTWHTINTTLRLHGSHSRHLFEVMKKPPFSAVDISISGYFATWLLSINKPPFCETFNCLKIVEYNAESP